MRDYELMVVLDPNLEEAGIEAANGRVSHAITQRGGEVRSVEAWGRRRLAYPIGRFRDGTYVLVRFQLEPKATTEIERALKLMEPVIRSLIVRPSTTAPQPAMSAPSPSVGQAATPVPAPMPRREPEPEPEPGLEPEPDSEPTPEPVVA